MNRTLAVTVREITERRSVLIAALVAGLLPFASPLLPGIRADRSAEVRDAWALAVALTLGAATAVAMGATVVARDLSEGRLTFDFARPLSWRAIWGGRFLGAMLLTILVVTVALLPTSLVGPLLPSLAGSNLPLLLLAALAAVLAVIPLAHAASVAIRSGSRWLAVDLVCGVVFVLIAAWVSRSLFAAMAWHTLRILSLAAGSLALAILWIASAAQVALGRTDLARGHAALSRTAWSGLLAVAFVLAGYTGWLLAPAPSDLTMPWGTAAHHGSWTQIGGDSPGRGDYRPAMLFDAATGHFLRLGSDELVETYFSEDGKRAIVARRPDPKLLRYEILVADLGADGAVLRETNLGAVGAFARIAVSEDGRRVATYDDTLLAVYEVDSGKLLASTKLFTPETSKAWAGGTLKLYFAGPDRVRLCAFRTNLDLYELDVAGKRLEETGELPLGFESPALVVLPNDRLFVHDLRPNARAYLLDARTGSILQSFEAGAGGKAAFRPLSDGRVVSIDRREHGRTIRVLSAQGAVERSTDLEQFGRIGVAGEVAPGKLVLAAAASNADYGNPDDWRVLLFDVDSGTVRETARGLVPLLYTFFVSNPAQVRPGEPATRLFRTARGIVVHDPLTGEQRVVAGHGPA